MSKRLEDFTEKELADWRSSLDPMHPLSADFKKTETPNDLMRADYLASRSTRFIAVGVISEVVSILKLLDDNQTFEHRLSGCEIKADPIACKTQTLVERDGAMNFGPIPYLGAVTPLSELGLVLIIAGILSKRKARQRK